MILIGLGALWGGVRYQIGTLANVGPGFFPALVGGILIAVGLAIIVTTIPETDQDRTQQAPDLRGVVYVIGSLLAFAALGVYGGLVPATFAVVFISAMGDRNNTIMQAFWLASALVVVSVIVFWWALRLQLPLFTWG